MPAGWPKVSDLTGPTVLLVDDRGSVLNTYTTPQATYCNQAVIVLEANYALVEAFPQLWEPFVKPDTKWLLAHEVLTRLVRESHVPRPAPPELRARHGYAPAPRLPCYRGVRTR